MSDLLEYLKTLYIRAKENTFEWKPIHPNNTIKNPVDGIYTELSIPKDGKYMYLKYSIQYQPPVDSTGLLHTGDGIKYYILHELRIHDMDEPFQIPPPTKTTERNSLGNMINDFGRFRFVFDDESTAKEAVRWELLQIISPYTYTLSDEDGKAWNEFLFENPWDE